MAIESAFIILFCVATAVAIAVRRLRVPYTVALVIAGLALGTLRDAVELPHLTKELLFSVFLPACCSKRRSISTTATSADTGRRSVRWPSRVSSRRWDSPRSS
jgi:Kef-type K+ transport system membrane component KefB